jgi:transcriptional regulator with GAF, ATPase, and Fis domain
MLSMLQIGSTSGCACINMPLQLKTLQRYTTILEVNRAVTTELTLDDILRRAYTAVTKVIPCDRMALSVYAPEHAALKLVAAAGQPAASFYRVGLMLDCKESHHGWVFQHQKPMVRRDLEKELQFPTEQPNLEEDMRSYCAVPLVLRRESLGVMIVLSSEKNLYSDQHADFLREVSNQLVLLVNSLTPTCLKHAGTKLNCPRCIASRGGQTTVGKHKMQLSEWGKKGGRGRKTSQPEA